GDREGHREGAALGDRQRAEQGRLRRRRRPPLRGGLLPQPGPVAEADPPRPDGPRVPRREAHGAPDGEGGGAPVDGRRDGGRRRRAASASQGSGPEEEGGRDAGTVGEESQG